MRIIAVTGRRSMLVAAGVLSAVLFAAAPAGAATSAAGLYLRGAGDGHGVGMSQYGAAGYALHGAGYREILRDYYAQTTLGHVSPSRPVTVLLRSRGSAVFSGATAIRGWSVHKLDPAFNYSVERAGAKLRVRVGRHLIGTFAAPLQVSGPGPLALAGLGSYRGSFIFRPSPSGSGVMTVNAVGLDDYVRGVVSAEMPPSWPAQALEAQAVAARTYAVTSRPAGSAFDVYADTRSQMYLGMKAETPSSDAAVAATSGQVVEYAGAPVVTYFFASSGGETESDQNVFPIAPEAWLIGRRDPYDDALNDPYHRWKASFTLQAAQKRLGRLVDGSLLGIKVLQRGVSPRIVKARVVGTRGSVTVTGLQLRRAFGTRSTWMSFTTVSSRGVRTSTTPAPPINRPSTPTTPTATTPAPTTTGPSGGVPLVARVSRGRLSASITKAWGMIERAFAAVRLPVPSYAVSGTVFPVTRGAHVTVEFNAGDAWRTVASRRIGADGSYSVPVADRGSYRVRYDGTTGPEITVG